MTKKMELMSPAGNLKSFAAAIEAGADAVYLGYLKFNARRPADNFDVPVLKKLCAEAHRRGKKVYVTLNIDLKDNELAEAAKVVEMLCQINVDALIVKDLGLISLLNRYYKGRIAIHASTQLAITSANGAKLAGKLGFTRAVLARELTGDEIKQISDCSGIETEVFVEGSMCFCVSGRCFMSSWVGGRSGNRGACTAPCRLSWEHNGKKFPYFSMKDMLLVKHLDKLAACGADTLKIEGRLKSPGWVSVITSIYRKALDCQNTEAEIEEFRQRLATYSARETGEGHFFGHENLVGKNENWSNYNKNIQLETAFDFEAFYSQKTSEITSDKTKAQIKIKVDDIEDIVTMKIQLPKKGKVGTLEELAAALEDEGIKVSVDDKNRETAAREIKNAVDSVIAKIKLLEKKQGTLPELSEEVKAFVDYKYIPSQRKYKLTDSPDKVVILPNQLNYINEENFPGLKIVNICVTPQITEKETEAIVKIAKNYEVIISFPPVIYETEEKAYIPLIEHFCSLGIYNFQADSLSMLEILSKNSQCKIFGGMWLSVLNRKSAQLLQELGCQSVYATAEADEFVLEALDNTVSGQLEALVYARLPLFISRVADEQFVDGAIFSDNIGTKIECRLLDGVSYFFSKEAFSLSGEALSNREIRFDHLTADLRFSDIAIWKDLQARKPVKGNIFNYSRKLV